MSTKDTVIVISQNYKITYKSLVTHDESNNENPIQIQTAKVLDVLDRNRLKLNGINVGVPELMSYLKWGDGWHNKKPELLYNYQNSASLNGIFLSQLLEKENFDPVCVENFQDEKDIIAKNLEDGAKYIVVSTTFMTDINPIIEICNFIKGINKETKIIVGGPLIYQFFSSDIAILQIRVRELLAQLKGKVDFFIVEKKGEKTLVELLNALVNMDDFSRIGNLVYYDSKEEVIFSDILNESGTMDEITIDYGRINNIDEKKYLSLVTSRGCVFRCKFCTYHETFPLVEYKSVDILEQELDSIPKLSRGKRMIRLADDNFAINVKRLRAFCHLVIEKEYDFNWSCFASHHSLQDPENVKLMAKSGCKLVFIGIESASQEILNNMNKKVKVEDFSKVISNLNEAGIMVIGSFVIGFPGETEETIEQNIRFINESGLTFYQLNQFLIFPHTQIYNERYQWKLRGFMHSWSHKTMDSVKAVESMVHIAKSVESSLIGGFSDTSIQGCLEYLHSVGLEKEDIIPLYEYYVQMLKEQLENHEKKPITTFAGFNLFKEHYNKIEKKIIC